ncbi:hypothetical protein [uncultured Sphingomonas sp.]|uniref:hypothetical protein n=1 Tax=uncultured Sphingomonas sp. TaxID=158754 RepID=UPI0025FC1E12|nr:hypothetical protein [uncultured Sphingomonas sp.]
MTAAIALAMMLAGAVGAQETGTLVKGRTPSAPLMSAVPARETVRTETVQAAAAPEALAAARSLAACAVRRDGVRAGRLLAAGDAASFAAASSALASTMSNCAGSALAPNVSAGSFRMTNRSLVKLLSEADLVGDKPPSLTVADAAATLPDRPWLGEDLGARETDLLATCLVNVQPEWTSYLAVTRPGSPEEAKGWAQVAPRINECLTKNVTLKTNKSQLRLAIADVVYRRAHGAVPVKAAN